MNLDRARSKEVRTVLEEELLKQLTAALPRSYRP